MLTGMLLLALSLTKPAFILEGREAAGIGTAPWVLFFLGWAGLFTGNFMVTLVWMANPVCILSVLYSCLGKKGKALIFSLLSLILALGFIFVNSIMAGESGIVPAGIVALRAGYYLWLASFGAVILGATIPYLKDKNYFAS